MNKILSKGRIHLLMTRNINHQYQIVSLNRKTLSNNKTPSKHKEHISTAKHPPITIGTPHSQNELSNNKHTTPH